ncbi:MAG: hypothetical protein AAB403_07730 [Planctomycetota bacterium]
MNEMILSAWIMAVALQEGNGRVDHAAYNRHENARGAWQVRPIMIKEVKRLTGKTWSHRRMHEPVYAKAFVRSYFKARLERGALLWDITRSWNGSGIAATKYANEVELRYWKKVGDQLAATGKGRVRG